MHIHYDCVCLGPTCTFIKLTKAFSQPAKIAGVVMLALAIILNEIRSNVCK